MIRKRIYRWHRSLSIIAMIPVLMWSVSALLHQANKYIRPQVSVNPVISGNYVSDGAIREIAKSVSVGGAVIEINSLTNFSKDYPASQRILPVIKVTYDDDLNSVAFIDPASGKVIRTANDRSRLIHKWFGYLHSYKFIPGDMWRTVIIMCVSLVTMLTAVTGFYVHFILKKRKSNTTRIKWMNIHRLAGLVMGLFLVSFSLSGFIHSFAELVPSIEGFESKFFASVHMLKFFPSSMETVRFWVLFLLAIMILCMLLSGIVLLVWIAKGKLKKYYNAARIKKLIDYGHLYG